MSEGSPNVPFDSSISDGLREAKLARGPTAHEGDLYFLRTVSMDSLIIHIPSIFKVYVAAANMKEKSQRGGGEAKDGGGAVGITEAADGKAP